MHYCYYIILVAQNGNVINLSRREALEILEWGRGFFFFFESFKIMGQTILIQGKEQ